MRKIVTCLAVCGFIVSAPVVAAEEPATHDHEGATDEELAKQLSNPVADLVSVPLQFNWDQGVGPDESTRFILNIQPVVPFAISKKWNLIGRWIMPYVGQPVLFTGGESVSGFSDILFSSFFSPREVKRAIWGVGPVLSLPTSTDPLLGSGKWSAGPTFVILKQSGRWTYGALANQLWSFADATDDPRSDVNQTYLQPFVAHGWKDGTTLTVSSETTANWEAASGEEWTVPLIVMYSKVTHFGPFPFSVGAAAGYYVETPDGGPDWKLRAIFTLILPSPKRK